MPHCRNPTAAPSFPVMDIRQVLGARHAKQDFRARRSVGKILCVTRGLLGCSRVNSHNRVVLSLKSPLTSSVQTTTFRTEAAYLLAGQSSSHRK